MIRVFWAFQFDGCFDLCSFYILCVYAGRYSMIHLDLISVCFYDFVNYPFRISYLFSKLRPLHTVTGTLHTT